MTLKRYSPINRNGPRSWHEAQLEIRKMIEWFDQVRSEVNGAGEATGAEQENVAGSTGMTRGTLVYLDGPFCRPATRAGDLTTLPLAVVANVIDDGFYTLQYGGRAQVRVTGSLSSNRALLQLSGTAGVVEELGTELSSGEVLWVVGQAKGAVSDGLVQAILNFSLQPSWEAV